MKKIIMIAGAVAVLAGGGAGAYFVLLKKPVEAAVPEGAAAEEQHAQADAPKDHGGGHGEEGGGDKPAFVEMDPLVVPIMDNDGIAQIISMAITIEVAGEDGAQKVRDLKPRIKDAMIQNMYGMLNQQAALNNGVIKVDYVKRRLNDVTAKVMGEGVVKDVLLQMVQQNPT